MIYLVRARGEPAPLSRLGASSHQVNKHKPGQESQQAQQQPSIEKLNEGQLPGLLPPPEKARA